MFAKIILYRDNGTTALEVLGDIKTEISYNFMIPVVLEDGTLLKGFKLISNISHKTELEHLYEAVANLPLTYQDDVTDYMAGKTMTGSEIKDDKLKVGDVVELKSGGPRMTVKALSTPIGNEITCIYLTNGTETVISVPESCLRKTITQ